MKYLKKLNKLIKRNKSLMKLKRRPVVIRNGRKCVLIDGLGLRKQLLMKNN